MSLFPKKKRKKVEYPFKGRLQRQKQSDSERVNGHKKLNNDCLRKNIELYVDIFIQTYRL